MESEPEKIQLRFKEKVESIKAGDFLRYYSEDGGYFTNQAGFRIDNLPVGSRIKIESFPLAAGGFTAEVGIGMPICEGVIIYKNGKTFFNLEHKSPIPNKSTYQESRFFNGDKIEIILLPPKQ